MPGRATESAKTIGLWRHRDFMKLWTGQAISELGSGLTGTALQLIAALSLGATPLQMGVLAALSAVPVLGLALFAGVWIDRLRRRPVMIAADLGRAALLLSIPVASALGVMRLSHLFVIMPMVSVLSVFFDTAYQSFLPTLVARDQLMEANSKLGAASAGAEIMAPGLGGLLVQAIGGPSTMLLDALSFLSSAVLVGLMRTPEAPPALSREQERLGLAIREGLRALLERPLFRTFAVSTLVSSFFGNFFAGLYTLYVVRVLGFGPVVLGVAVGCGGLGSLAGALLASRLTGRFGGGPVAAYAAAVCGLSGLFIPLAGGPPVVAAAVLMATQFVGDAAGTVSGIAALSLRQAVTPAHVMGRVNAAMNLLDRGVGPMGAVVGGTLGGVIGIRQTVAVAVVGSMAGLLVLFFSPVREYSESKAEE